ncbi:MAG TPA: anthranilate synthase component I family protein [Aliidongia sp.]|uniref:anthranilate synthase component I family protein n=1 Tax=Aliidongia sp. TaxID=1914230 RepID=UPI002DDD9BEF|nr:anthranilate synthase component I family protein [Aliidongia sp.]HEV2676394.1 anthranilate synthase component I family protein [Aliidongia sp.]
MTLQPQIPVQLDRTPIPFLQPLAATLALRRLHGADGVFLMEALAGPDPAVRRALVGFGPVLTLEVRDRLVRFGGAPDLVAAVEVRVAGLLDPAGKLDAAGGLWALLRAIRDGFAVRGHPDPGAAYGFGFFGYLGYDTVRFVEELPTLIPREGDTPDIALAICRGALSIDLVGQTAELITARGPLWDSIDLDRLLERLNGARAEGDTLSIPEVPAPLSVTDSIDQARYEAGVTLALDHIGRGDIYQVQLGHALTIRTEATPLAVYRRLRQRNPAPYMVLARLGGTELVGASPEVFLRIERRHATMRPLAGTIRRGATPEADAAAAEKLRTDPKEIAEHVMLVDLCRNDLGRVALPSSLAVTQLLATEGYSHVFHLVSTVTADLAPGTDEYDAIAAGFPAGTMSGAPKVRAMEIIEAIETSRRGLYAGAFGLVDFSGYVDTGLAIRSALHDGSGFTIRASAGIVADSAPPAEWRETLAKLGASYWAITGEELVP